MILILRVPSFFFLLLFLFERMRGTNSTTRKSTGLPQYSGLFSCILVGVQQFSALTTQSHSLPAEELLCKSLQPSPSFAASELVLVWGCVFQHVASRELFDTNLPLRCHNNLLVRANTSSNQLRGITRAHSGIAARWL